MEKEKRKNNQPPFFKTPVGTCCFSILKIVGLAIIMSPIIFLIFYVFVELSLHWKTEEFVQLNRPIVQEAVRNQCWLSDYVADGRFQDDSSYTPPYYDIVDSESRIDCHFEDDEWQCSCPESP